MATARRLPSGNYFVCIFTGNYNEKGQPIYQGFTASTKREAEFMAAEFALTKKKRQASTKTVGEAMAQHSSPANFFEFTLHISLHISYHIL